MMDLVALVFYGCVCGLLSLAGPKLGRAPNRIGCTRRDLRGDGAADDPRAAGLTPVFTGPCGNPLVPCEGGNGAGGGDVHFAGHPGPGRYRNDL